jgi:hypothetical protein
MNLKKLLIAGAIFSAVIATGCATAQAPIVDIGQRHGNLRDAQQLIVQAYAVIDRAQYDNHSQLGGHAAHAKELLSQADEELRLAADVANERR